MPYLGNQPAANFASVTKDTFSGNASTTAFTLSKAATTNGVAVYVENVRQIPTTAYTVSGTTLDFGSGNAPVSGTNNIYVLHHNAPASTATHPAAQALTATSGTFTSDVSIDGGSFVFNESSADKDFRIESNGNTHRLFVDGGNDQVLLGTTASRTMYGITPTTFQEGLDHETSSIGLVRNSNDGNGGYFIFGKSKGTALGSSTVVASGNDLGSIVWASADGTDMQSVSAMIVGGISDEKSPGANDVPGTLKFATANDGATGASHRMMIDAVGRIRLGSDGELKHRIVTQQTTSVGTSATAIANVSTFTTFGGHYFVTGRNADDSAARFCDQLTAGLNGSLNVLHSTTVRGSPASRSYDVGGENLRVAMGSGSNYTVNVLCIDHLTN